MNEHRAPDPVSHDEDFYAWTQQQAKLLRALQKTRSDLLADVDIAHVAEEIEDLGKAELRGATSLIRQIMIHLAKAASDQASASGRHWRSEVKNFHAELLDYYEPSMRQRIRIQELWRRALDQADTALRDEGTTLRAGIPEKCPFTLSDFVAEQLPFEPALRRLVGEPGGSDLVSPSSD